MMPPLRAHAPGGSYVDAEMYGDGHIVDCTACTLGVVHNAYEVRVYHPFAGHGYSPETGWTHPDLEKEAKEKGITTIKDEKLNK